MIVKDWNIEEQTGYKPLTTSFSDFSIAEPFGTKAIKDTYNKLRKEFKDNYKYETELVMALNWKIWQHYETNEPLARFYNSLWEELDEWFLSHYEDNEEAISYFFKTTDKKKDMPHDRGVFFATLGTDSFQTRPAALWEDPQDSVLIGIFFFSHLLSIKNI